MKEIIRKDIFEERLFVHACPNSDVVVINYPGKGGVHDGYNQKYIRIADWLVQRKIGSVVRMENKIDPSGKINYADFIQTNLEVVIKAVLQQPREFCRVDHPRIFISAFSAGASAATAIAHNFSVIKKLLLISTADDSGLEAMKEGLREYENSLFILSGDDPEDMRIADFCFRNSSKAARRERLIIKKCDHFFQGTKNGYILSGAYLWAFDDKINIFDQQKAESIWLY